VQDHSQKPKDNVFAHRLTPIQSQKTTYSLPSAKIGQTTDGTIAIRCYDSLGKVVVRLFAQDGKNKRA
jgi:hypothetical protein